LPKDFAGEGLIGLIMLMEKCLLAAPSRLMEKLRLRMAAIVGRGSHVKAAKQRERMSKERGEEAVKAWSKDFFQTIPNRPFQKEPQVTSTKRSKRSGRPVPGMTALGKTSGQDRNKPPDENRRKERSKGSLVLTGHSIAKPKR
jgi:hypothetical protein